MENPLVSIIIPTYNRAHLIGETLDSVLAQTYGNWECIIVDDGSTDSTEEVVTEYVDKDSRFQFHRRPEDRLKGGNAARNYGFKFSKGEYVNWFDDDDIMLNEFIGLKVDTFRSDLDFVITTGYNVNFDLSNREKIELYCTDELFKEYVLWKLKIFTPSIMFRKTLFSNEGNLLFSEKITRGQESEFFSRVFFNSFIMKYVIINHASFLYRQHEQAKTHQNNLYIKAYKFSQTYISMENLKRSLEIRDNELFRYYYVSILDYFFRALENNHKDNCKYILNEFIPIIKNKFWLTGKSLAVVGFFLCLINRGSYRVEKYFKSKKIKMTI